MSTTYAVNVEAPYRLDLTVAVLRRFSTNIVDVTAHDGAYVRAILGGLAPAIVALRQRSAISQSSVV